MNRQPLPHEVLLQICKKAAGDAVWAIEMGTDESGKYIWVVYCSNEKMMKKLPNDFMGSKVYNIFCKKP